MRDELPDDLKTLIARCEINESTFDNEDMSTALFHAEKYWKALREQTEVSDVYQTRCGYPVRIYANDGGSNGKRIHGAVFAPGLNWTVFHWLSDGRAYESDPQHEWDLVRKDGK